MVIDDTMPLSIDPSSPIKSISRYFQTESNAGNFSTFETSPLLVPLKSSVESEKTSPIVTQPPKQTNFSPHLATSRLRTNSTSTPVRSILKNNNQSIALLKEALLQQNFSPMSTTTTTTKQQQPLQEVEEEDGHSNNVSFVGLTQALKMINNNVTPLKTTAHAYSNNGTPIKIASLVSNKELSKQYPNVNFTSHDSNFFYKITLEDLFGNDDEDEASTRFVKNTGESKKVHFDTTPREEILLKSSMSSLEYTPIFMNKKKKVVTLSSSSSMEEQNDIQIINNDDESENSSERIYRKKPVKASSSGRAKKPRKKKSKFIMDEAELSDNDDDECSGVAVDVSTDEEEASRDEYDLQDSFVDDESNVSNNDSMMLHVYRQSIKSPRNNRGYMFNRPLRPITEDIFSQAPTQDTSYMYDSFCVADDHVSVFEKRRKKKPPPPKSPSFEREEKARFKRIKSIVDDSCVISSHEDNKSLTNNNSNSDLHRKDSIIEISQQDESNILTCPIKVPARKIQEEEDDEDDEFNKWLSKAPVNKIIEKKKEDKEDDENAFNKWINKAAPVNNKVEKEEDEDEFNKWLSEATKTNDVLPTKPPVTNAFALLKQDPYLTNKNKTTDAAIEEPEKQIPKNTYWIFVDNFLLNSGKDLLQCIRNTTEQRKLILQPIIHADFALSNRYGIVRFKWSELGTSRDQLIEKFITAQLYYPKVVIIIQDDREESAIRSRTKQFDSILSQLSKLAPILFAKFKTDELIKHLYKLCKIEADLGNEIPFDCSQIIDNRKQELSFYLSLPNVSIVNALYLCNAYSSIASFCNSSFNDLKANGKMSDKSARKLFEFIRN